jgi:hypothetical protein
MDDLWLHLTELDPMVWGGVASVAAVILCATFAPACPVATAIASYLNRKAEKPADEKKPEA